MATQMMNDGEPMNAKIWGELKNYIDLKMIYAKLPFREFFQMRLVCKHWNRLASDITFLEQSFKDTPIPKPYFILTAFRPEQHGLLTYETSSGHWNWTPLAARGRGHFENATHFQMEGASWSGHLENAGLLLCSSTCEVFNVHTRAFYRLPSGLASTSRSLPMAAMVVDSSVSPHSFQIIVTSGDEMCTHIYDSRSNCWTPRLSIRSYRSHEDSQEATISSVCCNGVVYLMSIADCDMDEVLIESYDLGKDEWSTLKPPLQMISL